MFLPEVDSPPMVIAMLATHAFIKTYIYIYTYIYISDPPLYNIVLNHSFYLYFHLPICFFPDPIFVVICL
jgi:hypothetical protein